MASQGAALGSQCCSLSWTANAVSLKPDQYSGIPLGSLFLIYISVLATITHLFVDLVSVYSIMKYRTQRYNEMMKERVLTHQEGYHRREYVSYDT